MSINTYKPLRPYDELPAKRWKASQQKSKWEHVQQHNYLLYGAFIRLLTRVKTLYKGSGVMAFEQDQRKDKFSPTTVYSFITKDLLFELECEYVTYECKLYYYITNCTHENQIRKMLQEYPFSISSVERIPQGGVAAYFARIRGFQEDKHFVTL